jgi:hypothetical protein
MLPYILAAVGGYLIGGTKKAESFSKGGDVDDQYRSEVQIKFYGISRIENYKGFELIGIEPKMEKIPVTFRIDVEHKSWGIRDIEINDIGSSYTEIEAEVQYVDDNDEEQFDTITIPIDWSKLETDKVDSKSITLGDTLEIHLTMKEDKIVIKKMQLDLLC